MFLIQYKPSHSSNWRSTAELFETKEACAQTIEVWMASSPTLTPNNYRVFEVGKELFIQATTAVRVRIV